jgi:hypothetical protein
MELFVSEGTEVLVDIVEAILKGLQSQKHKTSPNAGKAAEFLPKCLEILSKMESVPLSNGDFQAGM